MTTGEIGIDSVVYWARIHHQTGIYEVCELRVRTLYELTFVGVDKLSKQAFIIRYDDPYLFRERKDALAVVKEAEKQKKDFTKDENEYD